MRRSRIDPVIVAVNDAFGSLAINSTANVTIKITVGQFANGTTSVAVCSVNGYATFTNWAINVAGT